MATFKATDASKYGGTGGTGFFGIADDMGTKQVRFMYSGIEDVEGMSVHRVKVNDKERWLNCLREYNDPVDKCPFCREKRDTYARLFIPVYNLDEDQVQIWDRGKSMFSKISGLISRYTANGTLFVNNIFEVERHGKPKDTKTTYEIFQIENDGVGFDELPEVKPILGGVVLDKTAEEMEYYLKHNEFPDDDSQDVQEMPTRRRSAERRTPANRGDAF